MPHLDLNPFLSSLTPPAITIGAETYTGRLLSFTEVAELQLRLVQLERGELDLNEVRTIVTDLSGKLGIPVEPLLALPVPALLEVLGFFLRSLLTSPGPGASSSASSTSTPAS